MKYLFFLLLVFAANDVRAQQNNVATVEQMGSSHSATVNQTGGPGNEAAITQAGDHGVIVLDQVGAGNEAILNSLPGGGYVGSANYILLVQSSGAVATVNQTGSENVVWGLNPGDQARSLDGSMLTVTQAGLGNSLFLDQQNGSAASVVQMGMGNTATIIQSH